MSLANTTKLETAINHGARNVVQSIEKFDYKNLNTELVAIAKSENTTASISSQGFVTICEVSFVELLQDLPNTSLHEKFLDIL